MGDEDWPWIGGEGVVDELDRGHVGLVSGQGMAHGESADIDYVVDEKGGLKTVNMPRWGNPEGAEFHYANRGGMVEQEGKFGGYTIPTRMRIGWYFGSERFASEGEFFRVTIDDASYR